MGDARHGLRRTGEVGAAPGHFSLLLHDGVAARGAQAPRGFQNAVGPGIRRTFGKVHFQNGGDDFPRLFHQHGISDADVLPVDFILVVKGGSRHRGAGQQHGLEFRHGVSTPVRPTCTMMFSRAVSFCSGGNLYAAAQRGARAVAPRASRVAMELILMTAPSVP